MELEYNFDEGILNFNLPIVTKALKNTPDEFNLQLDSGRYFYGLATLPNVDSEGDKIDIKAIEEGAKTLTTAPYNKIFLGHNYSDIAIGIIVATKMSNKGLLILSKLNENHERAEEVWKSLNEGFLDGLSIGGSFLKARQEFDEKTGQVINVITKVIFREVSLTSIPANPEALTIGAFTKTKKIIEKYKLLENEKFKYEVNVKKDMENQNDSSKEATAVVEQPQETPEPQQNSTSEPVQDKAEAPKDVVETPSKSEEVEGNKDEPVKSQTPLLDALRKQLEELTQKNLELTQRIEKMEKEKEEVIAKKSIRQSVQTPQSQVKQKEVDKTPLLNALRGT